PTASHFDFQPCYDGLQCTRLELPLDYWNGTHPDKTISLAVAKLPARVPITDPRYGGAILVNPGGPGNSGIALIVAEGRGIQDAVDSKAVPSPLPADHDGDVPDEKYFDVLSFDPRGVAFSTPGGHCFESLAESSSWRLRMLAQGLMDSSDAALGRLWAMTHALGGACAATLDDADIKKYMTTASVARDMLELAEQHGAWRENEAARLLSESRQHSECRGRPQGAAPARSIEVPEHLRYKPDEEAVQYWGFSYGTYLGITFASMYPSRVGRLILDGVIDAQDYVGGLWSDNLEDTDKTYHSFYAGCAAAGPAGCALADANTTTPAAVEARVRAILARLYHNPLPVTAAAAGGTPADPLVPEILTWSDVRLVFFSALYGPMALFVPLARALAALERGDASYFTTRMHGLHTYTCSPPTQRHEGADGAEQAIACSDGDAQDGITPAKFEEYARLLEGKSDMAGAIWARIRLACTGWPIRPVHRFTGPFGGETKVPILFIGNTADPVTPVRNAHMMSAKFPGSVALTQDSPGHCSLAAPSRCTSSHIRAYLRNATLPAAGTVCSADLGPFEEPSRLLQRLGIGDGLGDGEGGAEARRERFRTAATQHGLAMRLGRDETWGLGRGFGGGEGRWKLVL
ncbi:TAP-like protein-domain-containing protein, partial [Lineolata rhizophorae]